MDISLFYLPDRLFTCILSQADRSENTPHVPLEGKSTHPIPQSEDIPRLRDPDPPSGSFPFFGLVVGDPPSRGQCVVWPGDLATCRRLLRPRPDAAARCVGRGVRRGDAHAPASSAPDPIPGEQLVYRLFNAIGETLPSMALARQAVGLAKGRSQASVVAAAARRRRRVVRHGATLRRDRVRRSPRGRVGRSCSPPRRPYDLVKPFADRLGLDDVVATRYGVARDGTYDGTLDGPFVWSAGKLAAITEWAERNGVDLAESYAYSDSVYDTPMLAAVGHPVVVNPDPRMVLVAAARRWPTLNLDVSPGVLKVPVIGLEVQELALRFARPEPVPVCPIRHRWRRQHPRGRRGDPLRRTIAATSTLPRCR